MADGNLPKPGNLSARYEAVSGGRSRRLEIYLARRYLSLSSEEWDKLPWHLQRTYMEGLEEEGIIGNGEGTSPQRSGESSSITTDLSGASPGDFAALGFRETNA